MLHKTADRRADRKFIGAPGALLGEAVADLAVDLESGI